MTKLNTLLCGTLLTAQSVMAQVGPPITCAATAAVLPAVRAEGKAELVSDIVLTCTGGNPAVPVFFNLTLFLNTNVTSNLTGPGPNETEALLLIDEPKPNPAANTSNGFVYVGQVKGTPGVLASGNVFTGSRTATLNQLQWVGVPLVPPGTGTRIFRITNIRALPLVSGVAPVPIMAFVAISGPVMIAIGTPTLTVGFAQPGLKFKSVPAGPSLHLQFSEQFPSAFKKRMENTLAGPTSAAKQNQPGAVHCTESGFNPDFTTAAPGDPGSANTGTRLAVKITGIAGVISNIVVPNQVISGGGQLQLSRITPPYGPSLSAGVLVTIAGFGAVPVVGGSATILYEVLPRPPFAGVNGCAVLDSFSLTAQPWPFGSLAGANVTGSFAQVNPTPVISGPAPEPRFN
jgi:hypothetical protein